jgi:hypothetical protein
MSSPQSPPRYPEPPPEALGPAVEDGAGGVTYGVRDTRQFVVSRQRDPDERNAEMAAARERGGCSRCASLPDPLVEALRLALAAARDEGRRQR